MDTFDSEVRLPFVQDERGSLRWVSDFTGKRLDRLPRVRCHGCREPVVLHLVPGQAPHATHADLITDAACKPPAGTLAREAARVHLRDQLRQAPALRSVRFCALCRARQEFKLAHGWDAVEIDKPLGTRTPHVLAIRGGRPMLAIDLFLGNELSAARISELDLHGTPWLLVKAEEVLEPLWTPADPLRAVRMSGGPWICASCESRRTVEEPPAPPARGRRVERDDDVVLYEGQLTYSPRVSTYRSAVRLPTRYAPAGTLSLRAASNAVQPWQEDFAHVALERIMEVDTGGELVRIHFALSVWSTAGGRDVLALTYRMMEGDDLSPPRPLATEPAACGEDLESWLELLERAAEALAPAGARELAVTFDHGWRVERRGCGCKLCEVGREAAARAPREAGSRRRASGLRELHIEREPQLALFPDDAFFSDADPGEPRPQLDLFPDDVFFRDDDPDDFSQG